MIRALPGRRHRWPDGAWSPENPFPETESDLSEPTDEIKTTYANRSIQRRAYTASQRKVGHDQYNSAHARVCLQIRLILPAGTAIGVRLSHASREG